MFFYILYILILRAKDILLDLDLTFHSAFGRIFHLSFGVKTGMCFQFDLTTVKFLPPFLFNAFEFVIGDKCELT